MPLDIVLLFCVMFQDQYGSQRMYGSIGWGVLMFIMGIVLDYSNVWPEAKCQMNPGERNYNVCFFMFALMMFIAFIVATQIQFRYNLNISSTAFNTTPFL